LPLLDPEELAVLVLLGALLKELDEILELVRHGVLQTGRVRRAAPQLGCARSSSKIGAER
jgi:hypothetical protein